MRNKKTKLVNEDRTRNALLTIAKEIGCVGEFKELLAKYDRLLRTCKNQTEVKHIQALALSEVNNLFQCEWQLQTRATILGKKKEEEAAEKKIGVVPK